jgi:hypothetical protein
LRQSALFSAADSAQLARLGSKYDEWQEVFLIAPWRSTRLHPSWQNQHDGGGFTNIAKNAWKLRLSAVRSAI